LSCPHKNIKSDIYR